MTIDKAQPIKLLEKPDDENSNEEDITHDSRGANERRSSKGRIYLDVLNAFGSFKRTLILAGEDVENRTQFNIIVSFVVAIYNRFYITPH